MTTDPSLIDEPTPPRVERLRRPNEPVPSVDRPANDEVVDIARDVEAQSPSSWLPVAVAFAVLAGVVYYFFGPFFATVG
jgi:hypothetical protein